MSIALITPKPRLLTMNSLLRRTLRQSCLRPEPIPGGRLPSDIKPVLRICNYKQSFFHWQIANVVLNFIQLVMGKMSKSVLFLVNRDWPDFPTYLEYYHRMYLLLYYTTTTAHSMGYSFSSCRVLYTWRQFRAIFCDKKLRFCWHNLNTHWYNVVSSSKLSTIRMI